MHSSKARPARPSPPKPNPTGSVSFSLLSSPLSGQLTSGDNEQQGKNEYLMITVSRGELAFNQDGLMGRVKPQSYVLLRCAGFFELSASIDFEGAAVRIPGDELRRRLLAADDHVAGRFNPDTDLAALLCAFVVNAAQRFQQRQPPNPCAFGIETIRLVALAVSAEERLRSEIVHGGRYRLRRRVLDYIEANICEESLTPRLIAARFGISVSYLYSLMRDSDMTVGSYMRNKRLHRAYELLVSNLDGHRTVSEIAYDVGFKNVSHFSRVFSRHYGIPPRDLSMAGRERGATPSAASY